MLARVSAAGVVVAEDVAEAARMVPPRRRKPVRHRHLKTSQPSPTLTAIDNRTRFAQCRSGRKMRTRARAMTGPALTMSPATTRATPQRKHR
jgi:hypothetical protein